MTREQALPELGAVVRLDGVSFAVWAPHAGQVNLVLFEGAGRAPAVLPCTQRDGYWLAHVPGIGHGQRYAFQIDGDGPFPDPCSRSQPGGVHAPSEVVDPGLFAWASGGFAPPAIAELVIYELHVGAFTGPGTFDAAAARLPALAELGVTAVELMPVAAFPGARNWGYDGAALFAPAASYGGPDGLRRFVDAAHCNGIAVLLDVVFNHFGPDGSYALRYSPHYHTGRRTTPWGAAINFDGPGSEHVRHFVVSNVLHWLREYRVDGFRFDAAHHIHDRSREHILAELRRRSADLAPGSRPPILIAETDENDLRYLRPVSRGGLGMDAVWADDFHHALHVLLTGERHGYYESYSGDAAQLARAIVQGFLHDGQPGPMTGEFSDTPSRDVPLSAFVYCLQNHDQVGNRAFGERLNSLVSRADYLAASLLLLLLPQTPLLFQGQEYADSSSFLYFTDHAPDLGALVTEGRRSEFARFPAFVDPARQLLIPDPQSVEAFAWSKLRSGEAGLGPGALCRDFYREALRLRRHDPVLRAVRAGRAGLSAGGRDRRLVVAMTAGPGRRAIAVNFGDSPLALRLPPGAWRVVLSSASSRWGGVSADAAVRNGALRLPAHCAVLLASDGQ